MRPHTREGKTAPPSRRLPAHILLTAVSESLRYIDNKAVKAPQHWSTQVTGRGHRPHIWADHRRFDTVLMQKSTPQSLRKCPEWRDRYV